MRRIKRQMTVSALARFQLGGTATPGPADDLAAAAAKRGAVIWYESSPPKQMARVIPKFKQIYLNILAEPVDRRGRVAIRTCSGRIVDDDVAVKDRTVPIGATCASLVEIGSDVALGVYGRSVWTGKGDCLRPVSLHPWRASEDRARCLGDAGPAPLSAPLTGPLHAPVRFG
jgi:hypothetical protein